MKGALIVGIDNYPTAPLQSCVNDAMALASLLETNGDGSKNFHVELLKNVAVKASLREAIKQFFKADLHSALFYFSGHGFINERGGFIVTPDFGNYGGDGISMHEILSIVNKSKIKDRIVILDCCHAGALGQDELIGEAISFLAEGVVIITSARQSEQAIERNGHGVFTRLLLEALRGGAADLSGNITPASIYAYIDRSLGFMEQRPQFKSNVNRFTTLRTVPSKVLFGK